MGKEEMVVHAWKEWGIQALVLLSLMLQVALLVLAEFRRRVRSGVLMFFIWSAYMLADATAIYVLGHMSVTSRSPEHQLVAFWAPFLLVHLGGQDNITAYAIEDNRLWLRHLQALVVQVAAAAYVLYESSIMASGHPLLRCVTVLMFLVGVIKYVERVLALWLASRSSAGSNYEPFEGQFSCRSPVDDWLPGPGYEDGPDTEAYILMAQRMLHVPMTLLKGRPPRARTLGLGGARLYKVVEMQLSLMHDIFYTKTEIIHGNQYNICIRIISAVAIATALVMFNLLIWNDHRKDTVGYDKVDVAVTYVLLFGAIILETMSFLRAAFSCWEFLRWGRGHWYWDIALFVRRHFRVADWRGRGWSASMGQHNLLQLTTRSRSSRSSKLARHMGLEDPWNMLTYSWYIPVSPFIEESMVNQLFERYQLEILEIEKERHRVLEREKETDRSTWREKHIERTIARAREIAIEREREEERKLEILDREREKERRSREMREGYKGGEEEGDKERGGEVVLEVNDGGPDPGENEAKELQVWGLERRPAELFDSTDPFDTRLPKTLEIWGLYRFSLTRSVEERILAWHIATNIYLAWWCKEHGKQPKEEHGNNNHQQPANKSIKTWINVIFRYIQSKIKSTKAEACKLEHSKQPTAEAIEALSNYMVFLLAARPDMLSPTGSRTAYANLCYELAKRNPPWKWTAGVLADKLRSYGDVLLNRPKTSKADPLVPMALQIGCKLGAMLIRKHAAGTLDLIAQVWVETLYHAAQGCSAYAHAKHLGNGGELITIAAILVECLRRRAIRSF